MSSPLIHKFEGELRKISTLNSIIGLLSWDQEICLPAKGRKLRSEQIALLTGSVHQLKTSPEFVELVADLLEMPGLSEEDQANVRETWRHLKRSIKIPKELVEETSAATSAAFHAWREAREKKQFEIFGPFLEKLVSLKKQEVNLIGFDGHLYNGLLEEYEPGMDVDSLDLAFEVLKDKLSPIIKTISQRPVIDDSFMRGDFPEELQLQTGREYLSQMGYSWEAGRMDKAPHPFCIGFNPHDVRVTYEVDSGNISRFIWAILHEGGHALYEQGLNVEKWYLPVGSAGTMSLHESQSRLWENMVGRGKEFWSHNFPKLKQTFPGPLRSISTEMFYSACNKVQPGLIRIHADELTYHFHILIRYEIEKELFAGSVSVGDLPALWNRSYRDYLGLEVDDDGVGVLQDIHWSHGAFGYFPTYSLGSFYAAQFFDAAERAIPDLSDQIKNGNLATLREWLRIHIHQWGHRYSTEELCERVTGQKLNSRFFMEYITKKYGEIYALN
jgi:carboxypeptidase Taq